MDDYKNLIWWLRWMGTQTGEATYTRAADAFENMLNENAALRRQIGNLTDAQAAVVKEFDKKLEELHETKSELDRLKTERDAAVEDLRKLAHEHCTCYACENDKFDYDKSRCTGCQYNNWNNWSWRGPQGGGDG